MNINMNYQESIKLLTSQEKFHIDLSLTRMKKLAEIFHNPQDDLKIIHVAGTNGKGSTCAMLSKIFEENGYRTGLFTSPHIKKYNERFKINFKDISDDDFAKYLLLVENTAKQHNINLTEFEILTMMAFLYFKDMKTDIVLLETGMGGRLDATNIINKPLLTIIVSISFDHTDRLGKTLEEIAGEKAGILKSNAPVIISKNNLGYDVIKNKADEIGSNVLTVEKDFELFDIENNIFSNGEKCFELSLKGVHQSKNLTLVIKACEYLKINPNEALKKVIWNSRLEYIKEKNLIVDAAHNPDAAKLLKDNLDKYYKNKKRAFLFGVLNTKDYKKIIENLFNEDDEIYVTDNFAHNAIDKGILKEEILSQYKNIKVQTIKLNEIEQFFNYKFDGIKICTGSFYICSH
ncbi:MAG: bifunctional folylpolyglutamate synthase/dihydrofolate synthase, partial [Candidatus Gastranaerophilales bacterium]|nr:bifunctional folylpolyglutamate synthase/dihydrofolate synthase [Candidatus Gastranaerophilales bacterium]